MRPRRRWLRVAIIAVTAAPLIYQAIPAATALADDRRSIMTLPAETQTRIDRPTLDAIKAEARNRNIELAQAIDEYVTKVVATDPRVTARARADGLDDKVEPEVRIDDLWLSELTDLKLIAKTKGITLEEAIERVGWQPRINAIGTELTKLYPEEISGLAITEEGRGARIGFKGSIPSQAVALAKTLPVSVQLVGDKGFSETDLKRALDAAHQEIRGRAQARYISGKFNIETGEISFTVVPRNMPTDAQGLQQFVSELQPTQPVNDRIKIKVTVTEKTEVDLEDNYMRGGGYLGGCTSGFNITNGSSYRHASARHCGTGGTKTYRNHSAQGGSGTATYSMADFEYDISAWTQGSMSLTRTFYYDWNTPRYAYYVGTSPAIGQTLCHFGIATSTPADCADIEDYGVTLEIDGEIFRGVIVMSEHITAGGDSGGPWYYGNHAWGIHGGYCSILGGCGFDSSFFTPAYLIPSAFGSAWRVWTAPPGT